MRLDNLAILKDTLGILEKGFYVVSGKYVPLKLSRAQMEEAKVFLPRDIAAVSQKKDFEHRHLSDRCAYACEHMDSFSLARKRIAEMSEEDQRNMKQVLVLNLANAVSPGGGVRRGAKAQEEDLCRKSSLLISLERMFDRITGMLKVAAYLGYERLVLGAFGCGAFRNDARVVSDLFYKALNEFDFDGLKDRDLFRQVDFAVLDHSPEHYNFREFSRNFSHFYQDEDQAGSRNPPNATKEPSAVIRMIRGDITKVTDVEAIANAANRSLLGGGGVDGAIHRAAGPQLLEECRSLGGCNTGDAKLTKAYRLPCKYVIHTVGPVWGGGTRNEAKLLADCYRNSLQVAIDHQIRSVAFPSISTGVYSYPVEEAAKIAVRTVKQFIEAHPGKLDLVEWVLFDRHTFDVYEDALNRMGDKR